MVKVIVFSTLIAGSIASWVAIGIIGQQRSLEGDKKKEDITWWDVFKKVVTSSSLEAEKLPTPIKDL